MSAGLKLYYIVVFVVSAIPEDLEALTILQIGSFQVYLIDLVYGLIAVSVWIFVTNRKGIIIGRVGGLYVAFLLWLVIEVLIGVTRFQFRAIGESRYIIPLFAFVVPFLFVADEEGERKQELINLFLRTILVAGMAGVVVFVIEVLNGGRFFLTEVNRQALGGFEDFRGTRILGSTHTFNIMALAALLFLKADTNMWPKAKYVLLSVGLFAAALVSQNRTAIISIVSAILILTLVERRIGRIIVLGIVGVGAIMVLGYAFPVLTDQIVASVTGAFYPASDATGSWRLALNLSALDQALETPFLGQGYGGYFYFLIPGARPEEAPPHNQFIILFLKAGIVGLGLCLLCLSGIIKKIFGIVRMENLGPESRMVARLLFIIVVSQLAYGMAYNFAPLFGIYAGIAALYIVSFNDQFESVVPQGTA